MEKVRDIYLKLLLGALILFAIGVTWILSDLYNMIGGLEHDVMHLKGVGKSATCKH